MRYDIIVIGGGVNGLTVAAYLAKAGAKTLVLEARHEIGGGLVTEDFCGFRYNLHAMYHLMAEIMPPYIDLKLRDYGCRYVTPDVQIACLFEDGKSIVLYRDIKKTLESIKRVSKEDVKPFEKMYHEFKQLFHDVIFPLTYTPPKPPLELVEELSKTEVGKEMVRISDMSVREIIEEEYGFMDDRLKMLLIYLACSLWGIDPELTGIGYLAPLYIYRGMNTAICVGGSHALASALGNVIVQNGGHILENAKVEKIIVRNGRATGVELLDKRTFEARAVVSTVDPHQTFLKFVGEGELSSDFIKRIRAWKWEERTLFGLHLSLKGIPRYKAAELNPDVNNALIQVIGHESLDELLNDYKNTCEGRLPHPGGHISYPSIFDPLQAPKGYHVGRLETFAPFELREGTWDEVKEKFADECIKVWESYAPNISKNIIFRYAYPPTYIEEKLIDMVRGSIKQGAYIPIQMGYFRPNELCSNYRTPINGLYVCGSCVYPGGGITAGPGYNASKVIAQDLGIRVWW